MITSYPVSEYLLDVARGKIGGAQPYGVYGKRTTAGAESNVLWPNGAYSFPSSAGVQMSIVSSSANDTSAGTGIRSVDLIYLDANLAEQTESVTLNGTTPVLTVATNIRFIQCMIGTSYGSGKSAAGNISASNGGNTYSYIAAGDVRCSSSVRMVPAGKRIIVTSFFGGSVSGTATAGTNINMASPAYDGYNFITSNVFIPLVSGSFQDNSAGLTIPVPLSFTEGQVIGMTFSTDKAATITGSWFGLMENA